ncbi:MAG: subtype A tannase [Candidatus Faecivicinus sp.]
MKRLIGIFLALAVACGCCAASAGAEAGAPVSLIDSAKWQYNEEDDVYWQVGIPYCSAPADLQYETLGVFIPGAYFDAIDNGDGTYTCTVNPEASVGGYTAETAPIVLPVDTPGYAAMPAPTDYVSAASSFTDAGFIYAKAGCRGRDAGAPAGVTDLKAAIRYLRCTAEVLPGNTDRIFSFGMSGGGAQSALLGATGDSTLYEPYLSAIGAVENCSDAVLGSMCWCPITNLDTANEAYEWNLGVSRTDLDETMQALSDGLADAYTDYINALGLVDPEGTVLTLDGSARGIEDSGSYIEALRALIESSLNHFLEDTAFPYAPASSGKSGFGGDRGDFAGALPDGEFPAGGKGGDFGGRPDGEMPDGGKGGDRPTGGLTGGRDGELSPEDWINGTVEDGVQRLEGAGGVPSAGETYETAEDYIAALNGDDPWIQYDSASNTATILSISRFVTTCKSASKSVGAFDDLNRAQAENLVFGYGDGQGAHFDSVMAELLAGTEYAEAFTEDLQKTDALGSSVEDRLNMYNPMYYIEDYYEGYQSSNVAPYWRIRTGINQGDTALTTEMNLALALQAYGADVDFETVWAQAHVEAERTGSSTDNFIAWVSECLSDR